MATIRFGRSTVSATSDSNSSFCPERGTTSRELSARRLKRSRLPTASVA
jgi:hypothetical protein